MRCPSTAWACLAVGPPRLSMRLFGPGPQCRSSTTGLRAQRRCALLLQSALIRRAPFGFACRLIYDVSGLAFDYPGIAVRAVPPANLARGERPVRAASRSGAQPSKMRVDQDIRLTLRLERRLFPSGPHLAPPDVDEGAEEAGVSFPFPRAGTCPDTSVSLAADHLVSACQRRVVVPVLTSGPLAHGRRHVGYDRLAWVDPHVAGGGADCGFFFFFFFPALAGRSVAVVGCHHAGP